MRAMEGHASISCHLLLGNSFSFGIKISCAHTPRFLTYKFHFLFRQKMFRLNFLFLYNNIHLHSTRNTIVKLDLHNFLIFIRDVNT